MKTSIKFSLLGHSGRCFDIRLSNDEDVMLSASEDGTARLWSISTRRSLFTFTHNLSSEVLRVTFLDSDQKLVSTCGSDGDASIWQKIQNRNESNQNQSNKSKISYEPIFKIPHGDTQIYACESIDDGYKFLTAAENSIYIWNTEEASSQVFDSYTFESLSSSSIEHSRTSTSASTSTVASTPDDNAAVFGGPRNPDMLAYVFDAKIAPTRSTTTFGVIAVGLSDGTVRLVDSRVPQTSNSRSAETTIPVCHPSTPTTVVSSHITSICWHPSGDAIVASLGSGANALLDLRTNTSRAYFEAPGRGRACFGSQFRTASCGLDSGDSECISWSSDGVRVWSASGVTGLCRTPLRSYGIPNFAVYCGLQLADRSLLCGGGTGQKSFIGEPLYAIDIDC